MRNNTIIKLNQITMNYRDPETNVNFQALRGVDLSVRHAAFSSIIGPSGAGKSTLLNIIGGMVKPSTGTILSYDLPVHNLDSLTLDYYRRRIIGFLWQLPELNMLPTLTAKENIIFAMKLAHFRDEKPKKRAEELLSSVGLKDRYDHKLHELSGGEAQRASLAIALANSPKILLADEPTGELDSATTLEIISYLKEINNDLGTTILVVTHDQRFSKMTDESFHILDGTIAGLRRTVSDREAIDWQSVEREEISIVDQFGRVRIPEQFMTKFNIEKYVKFKADPQNNQLILEAIKEEEEN